MILVPPGLCKPAMISRLLSLARCFHFRLAALRRCFSRKICCSLSSFHLKPSNSSASHSKVLAIQSRCSSTVAFQKNRSILCGCPSLLRARRIDDGFDSRSFLLWPAGWVSSMSASWGCLRPCLVGWIVDTGWCGGCLVSLSLSSLLDGVESELLELVMLFIS